MIFTAVRYLQTKYISAAPVMQERELWQNRFNPLGISKIPTWN